MFRTVFLASAGVALLAAAGAAEAGQQYVDETGYALSGYDPVAYFELKQAPVGERQPEAVPGKTSLTAEYNGAKWAFASAEHRDRFLAEPQKYAPQFDGHCAFGVYKGGKVPGNPNLWRTVEGKLYVNITPQIVEFWVEDIPGHITAAEKNWGELEAKPASDGSWKSIKANDGTYSTGAPAPG